MIKAYREKLLANLLSKIKKEQLGKDGNELHYKRAKQY